VVLIPLVLTTVFWLGCLFSGGDASWGWYLACVWLGAVAVVVENVILSWGL
jgi:hypothetical protein